jgi:hypothetical protein
VYTGHRLLLGGQYTLPWRAIRLHYDLDVHFRNYRYNNSVLPTDAPNTVRRKDTEVTHLVGLAWPLPYGLTFALDVQLAQDRSNLDVFTFTRNVVTGALIWTY